MREKVKIDVNMDKQDFIYEECSVCVLPVSHTYIPWHAHGFYELVLVVEGFCFHHIEDTVSLIREGDILLIKPGVSHQYSGIRECRIINCLFKPEALTGDIRAELLALPELFRLDPEEEENFPQIHLAIRQRESLQKAFEQIEKEYVQKDIGWQFKIKTVLFGILVDYARCCNNHRKQEAAENRYSVHVNRAIQYVAEHYAEELSVQSLAEKVGISPDYLSRQFQQMIGVAVHDYIQRYRISRSLSYLQQGCSVKEAGEKCGYSRLSYFSYVFKKEVGIAPTLYKQRLIEKK